MRGQLVITATCVGIYCVFVGTVYGVSVVTDKIRNAERYAQETRKINKKIPEQFKGKEIKNIHRWQYQYIEV